MKLNLKKIVLGASILTFSLTTISAKAAGITLGSSEEDATNQNIIRIPITLNATEADKVSVGTLIDLNCTTPADKVTCTVEYTSNELFNPAGNKLSYIGTNDLTTSSVIGKVVVTNSGESKATGVSVNITGTVGSTQINEQKTNLSIYQPQPKSEVTRQASDNAKLSVIRVSQGQMTPAFNKDVTDYVIYDIKDTISTVIFDYVCDDDGQACDVAISGGKSTNYHTVTLNQGENKVTVTSTSENKANTVTYNFTVLRGDTGYNSEKLSELSFGDFVLTPAFSKDVTAYNLTIPNNINTLANIIKYKAEDEKAKVTVTGLDNLVNGENTLTIVVDSVMGDKTSKYTITVKKLSDDEVDVIKYKDNQITYVNSNGEQIVTDVDTFKVNYPKVWEKIENKEIKFDEDGNLIVENKEATNSLNSTEKKDNKTLLLVLLIIGGLAIIGVSGFFIFRKKKDKTPKKKEDNKEETVEETTEEVPVSEEKEEVNEEVNEETKVEDNKIDEEHEVTAVDIDTALSDLMDTKSYEFKDKE